MADDDDDDEQKWQLVHTFVRDLAACITVALYDVLPSETIPPKD